MSVAVRLAALEERIRTACEAAGRRRQEVTLVAVTKTHDAVRVREVVTAGVTDLGENYVQELLEKADTLSELPVRWHFIGGLQKNKVKKLIGRVELIHAVDSLELAAEIDKRARAAGVVQAILLAVSAAGEAQKTGATAEAVPALLEQVANLPGLHCRGFMTMPPLGAAEAARPYFRALRELRDRLQGRYPDAKELSMGMSEDFEVAISEGATLIRVGTALVGPRGSA